MSLSDSVHIMKYKYKIRGYSMLASRTTTQKGESYLYSTDITLTNAKHIAILIRTY